MKRNEFLLYLLLLLTFNSNAQFSWYVDFPGQSHTSIEGLSIDPQDNVIVIGHFDNGVSLMNSNYTGKGSFLLKLTNFGVPLWHKIVRYSASDFGTLTQVKTDGSGNIYIAGTFPQAATLDDIHFTGGVYNQLLVKFNADGEVQWTKKILNLQETFDMDVNNDGTVLLYSRHWGTVTIDNTVLQVGPNSFGVLISTNGDVLWAKSFGIPGQYSTWPKSCSLDEEGNAYFYGIFSGSLLVDQEQVISSGGNYDLFFAKVNTQGTCEWLTSVSRKAPAAYESDNPASGLIVDRSAMAIDHLGNIYAAGTYWQDFKAEGITLSPVFSDPFATHLFLLKLNANGHVDWAVSPPTTSVSNTIDALKTRHNKVYFSGLDFPQFYFSVYSASGDALEHPVTIPLSGDWTTGLGVDAQEEVYLGGRVNNPTTYLEGFVLRYGFTDIQLPGNADAVSAPSALCINTTDFVLSTEAIPYAEWYEWEISTNNQVVLLTTENHEMEINIADLNPVNEIEIRVRGMNPYGAGTFSPVSTILLEQPLPVPVVSSTCKEICLVEGEPPVKWYRDNTALSSYENQTRILPDISGQYFVTVTNGCGSMSSNVITFTSPTADSFFIPNIITPNGDKSNEFFIVDNRLESPRLHIINRWGMSVYYADAYANNWKGEDLLPGVYFYSLISPCLSTPIRGTLTIIR